MRTLAERTQHPGDNNHGVQFNIMVATRDVAGNNPNEKLVKLTIDTSAPALIERLDDGCELGREEGGGNSGPSSAIKVVFNEALDADTVDVSDFVVERP